MAATAARPKLDSREDYLARYPRTVAHIIAGSLGYASPLCAAGILWDAHRGRPNGCEWVYSCFKCDARACVRRCVHDYARHNHRGFMASYTQAREIVRRAVEDGQHPMFGSWF